jgi:hypothetical protein
MTSRLDAMRGAAQRGDAIRRVDYIGAVAFVAGADSVVPVTDAVSAYEVDGGFLRMQGRINGTGVYQYEDEDGNTWGELRLAEHVFADGVIEAWKLSPLTDDHPDEFVTSENWAELAKGTLGADVRPDEAREYTLADIACNDADLIAKVKGGKKALSCGYLTKLVEQPGEHNGVAYRFIQTEYVPNHVSVVDEARGPGCEFIIDGVRSVRSRPPQSTDGDSNMKKTKIKVPKGKNADGSIMVGEAEMEVPDEVAAMIADLQTKVMEQGAELAKLQGEGDAEAPAEAPAKVAPAAAPMDAEVEVPASTDSKAPRAAAASVQSNDATEARLAFLEAKNAELIAEQKQSRDGFGLAVSARVALIDTARKVIGPTASIDGLADIDIKRAVITAVSPTIGKSLDGKSVDYIEASYTMALEQHAKSKDSSGQLLSLTGRAALGGARPVLDLNKIANDAKTNLRTSATAQAT